MSLDVTIVVVRKVAVFDANITHNLRKMAKAVSEEFYKAVWHPEDLGITTTTQLYNYLFDGLVELKSKPDFYRQFDSPNGWGVYEHFVPWLENYLKACEENPDGEIEVSG